MKKIISLVLAVLFIVSTFTIYTFAAESPTNSYNISTSKHTNEEIIENIPSKDEYTISSIVPITQIYLPNNSDIKVGLNMEHLINNSTNVVARGTSLSGSYQSPKYDAGLPGYKYRISFDWTAATDSEGNYIFSTMTNPVLTTYENSLLLALAYSIYSYDITVNYCYISTDKKTVVFVTKYVFDLYDKNHIHLVIPSDEYTKITHIDKLI